MVGLGSGAENHTLLLNLEIFAHFRSTISLHASPVVTFLKQKHEIALYLKWHVKLKDAWDVLAICAFLK